MFWFGKIPHIDTDDFELRELEILSGILSNNYIL